MPSGIYKRSKRTGLLHKAWALKNSQKMAAAGRLGAASKWKNHVVVTKYYLLKKAAGISTKPNGTFTRKSKLELLERKRFRNQRYKANKRSAYGSHSFDEWLLLKAFYQYMCLCCKAQEPEIKLTEDHIVPLSRGGSDSIDNIQPLCVSCNTRKHARVIDYRSMEGGEKEIKFS